MATDGTPQRNLEANDQLGKVLAEGPDGVSILRGFIGASERDGYVRLYPSLADTSISVEIAEADVVQTGDVLDNNLGKRIVWIKKGALITVTKSRTTEFGVRPKVVRDRGSLSPPRSGRLQMQVRSAAGSDDVCASVCSCGTCQSQCTNNCGICICLPVTLAE